jgi:hypothetical protein
MGNLAQDIAEKVGGSGGNFLSKLFAAPMDFVKGAVSAPLGAVLGLGKGAVRNTLGNPFGLLAGTAIGMLSMKFLPDAWVWIVDRFKGTKLGDTLSEDLSKGDWRNEAKIAALAALAVQGITGGIGGALNGAANSGPSDAGFAGKTGKFLGTAATLAGLGYLAFQAVNSNKIGFAGNDDNTTPNTPDNTPAKPSNIPAKTT